MVGQHPFAVITPGMLIGTQWDSQQIGRVYADCGTSAVDSQQDRYIREREGHELMTVNRLDMLIGTRKDISC